MLLADVLPEGEMRGLRVSGRDLVLVHHSRDQFTAFEDRCPHAGSRLSAGNLVDGRLQCTTHLWEFDAATGVGLRPQDCRLRGYPVKVQAGIVWVRVRSSG